MDKRVAVAMSETVPKPKSIWKTEALIGLTSDVFARKLCDILQDSSDEGYELYSMISRHKQEDLVLVFHKVQHPTLEELQKAGVEIPKHILEQYGMSVEDGTSDPTIN